MTVLIYIQSLNPRVSYIFRHICKRMLGLTIVFTSKIEKFIAHDGPKFSYLNQPLGKELYFQSVHLLFERGIEACDIQVMPWEDTQCFFKVNHPDAALPFDIFAASFYLLTRYEEYLPSVTDTLGRFQATESIAYQNQFLEDPVVDIWVAKFKTVLRNRYPEIQYEKQHFKICPIVMVSQTYAYAQKGMLRSIGGTVRDLSKFEFRKGIERIKVLLGIQKDPYDIFDFLIQLQQHKKRKAIVFFGLGGYTNYEKNIHSANPQHIRAIKHIADYILVGLKISYDAITTLSECKKEKKRLEHIIHRTLKYASCSFFKIKLPAAYRNFVELEIEKDYSMGYSNHDGFRAGTCTPFLFYDLDYEVQTPLKVHSFCHAYTRSNELSQQKESEEKMKRTLQKVKAVNGLYIIVFTNAVLSDPYSRTVFQNIWYIKESLVST